MNNLRILYHLGRADFLERVRRYSFMLMLGIVVWLGYLSASGQFPMFVDRNYIGITNSAWAGGIMTITVSSLLTFVGFYIVKGSVQRDYATGVGQIMATTPLSRPMYMLGKWLSNFAVLGICILILLLEGIAMNLLAGIAGFDLAALAAPLAFIALPAVGLVAAIAVLFESVSWLRGGLGNVAYFLLYMAYIGLSSLGTLFAGPGATSNPFTDITGYNIIGDSITRAAKVAYPEVTGFFSFMGGIKIIDPKYFTWTGMTWTSDVLLSRLLILAIAVGLVIVSAVFFDRFNPSRPLLIRRPLTTPTILPTPASQAIPVSNVHLTPLSGRRSRFQFGALFLAELKLFLKGQRWWWYVIAAGLVVAQLFNQAFLEVFNQVSSQASSPIETTRTFLIAAWAWPILILGGLGCRENRFDTRQIVFAAPHPVAYQLPAAWLSAFVVMAALGSGALIKFILLGETLSVLGWLTGAAFIPALALFLGILTGSSKAFEAVYAVWIYALLRRVIPLDFAALTPESPWYNYVLVALFLFVLAALARQRQLTAKNVSR